MFSQLSDRLQRFFAGLKWGYLASFRGRLITVSVSLFVILLWTLVWLASAIQQTQFGDVLFGQQFASTQRIAADLDNKLRERVQVLTGAASNLPSTLDSATLNAHLPQLPGLHALFSAGIAVIRLDGKALADYPVTPGRRGTYFGDRDYFIKVANTSQPYIDKPIMGRALKRPVLTISVPVFDSEGKLRAVMTGITDLTAPNFLGVVLDRTIFDSGQVLIVSPQDKIIVAASDARRVLTAPPPRGANLLYDRFVDGFEGSGIAASADGLSYLYSGKYVPVANWLVVVALPTDIAFRPVTVMRNYLIVAAAILTLLAIVLLHGITRRMFVPLNEAGSAMLQMTAGATPLAPLPVTRQDEIGGLIDNFNAVVEDRHNHQVALAASEQRFRTLAENAPNPIIVQTRGCIVYLNAVALQLFGGASKDELLGQPIINRVHPDERASVAARIRTVNEERKAVSSVEERVLRLDGTVVHVEISAIPYQYDGEHGALVFVRDITERKLALEALRQSEARFQCLAALSSEWYWEQDEHYRFTSLSGWNPRNVKVHAEHVIGKTRWEMSTEDDPSIWGGHRAVLDARLPFADLEYKFVMADDSVAWFSINGEPKFDNNDVFKGYWGTGKDITERKQAEVELRQSQARIRELAAHQAQVKEDERRRIARDIHDELGQTLLSLRIDVSMLATRTGETHPRLHKNANRVLEHIDGTMKSVKRIINDLRPAVLDLGLLAALEWQTREFQRSSGIACELDIDDDAVDRCLDENRAASVFRIVQESLTNIIRHAQASEVVIAVRTESDQLVVTVADDGVGIVGPGCRKKNSFGLVGIEERVSALCGTFTVDSNSGQGTVLTISIPIAVPVPPPVQEQYVC